MIHQNEAPKAFSTAPMAIMCCFVSVHIDIRWFRSNARQVECYVAYFV